MTTLAVPVSREIVKPEPGMQSFGQENKKYSIFMGTAFEKDAEPQAARRIPFYEEIARTIEMKINGVILYVPHRIIKESDPARLVYDKLSAKIRQSNLIIADIDGKEAPSTAVGVFIGIACGAGVPFISFCKRGNADPSAMDCINYRGRPFSHLEFEDEHSFLEKIAKETERFFKEITSKE